MYKLILRGALIGTGFLILPNQAGACGLPQTSTSHICAQDGNLGHELSSRRKVGRHAAVKTKYRHVRGYKRAHYAYKYRHGRRAAHGVTRSGSVSLAGVVSPLAAKTQQIVASCGSRVVSGVRHGGHSNHSIGRAVDLQGNPGCIYSMLRGWPGGVSTDYASAPGGPHVHVSYSPGGREWGLRFAHRGGGAFSASARRAYAQAYPRRTRNVRRSPMPIMPAMWPLFPNF